jgi:ATP-dependent Clp protease ATP-binding subunit ClpA
MAAAGGQAPAVEEVMALTRDRSFKKVVRARMRRTGESYTAARAQVERSAPPSRPANRGGSGMYPFERFTERAKTVLKLAQQEAELSRHSYIGTEHLLLGILREEGCLARIVLNALGVELEPARGAITAMLGAPRIIAQSVLPTSRVKKVIELAFVESVRVGHNYVGTEHLLLGLLIEGEGVAAKVLQSMGVTLDTARAEIDRQFTERGAEPPGPPPTPIQHFTTVRPMAQDVRRLMVAASALAGNRGSSTVNLDHLLDAMISSAGIEALARLLDVRRHAAAKEQAIASQDYEAAAEHRTAERKARQALDQAIAAWRQELEPPPEEGAS